MKKKKGYKLSPIEQMYVKRYNVLPEEHFCQLVSSGRTKQEAGHIVHTTSETIYQEMHVSF